MLSPLGQRRRNDHAVSFLCALGLACLIAIPSPLLAWDSLGIQAELRRPGVKLLVVEFYADFCEPCKKAVPLWNELHEDYKDRGLRFIVVSVGTAGSCVNPGWVPDRIVCDLEGRIQESWGAKELPQAFLFSWQGNLLAAHSRVETVQRAVESYFASTPRILVSDPQDEKGQVLENADGIREMVRNKMAELAKFEMVASSGEMEELRRIRRESTQTQVADGGSCELGKEVSANSELRIRLVAYGTEQTLILQLFSVETGCLIARSEARIGQGGLKSAVFEAVSALLYEMVGDVSGPPQDSRPPAPTGPAPDNQELSYEDLMQQARDLEQQKEQRSKEIDRSWEQAQEVASQKALPVAVRRQFVSQFIQRYGAENPHLRNAQDLLLTLGADPTGTDFSLQSKEGPLQWVYSKAAGLFFSHTEVTVREYRLCVAAGACEMSHHATHEARQLCNWGAPDREEHPMNCVDWVGAEAFCRWSGGRLATPEEWIAEASDQSSRSYPWGEDKLTCELAIWGDETNPDGCGREQTWPVCSKPDGQSVSGLCDMAGNVSEWTSNPKSTAQSLYGGAWFKERDFELESTAHVEDARSDQGDGNGIRCVRDALH